MIYIGLIGDIVNSKKINIDQRIEIQKNIEKDLNEINDQHKDKIAANLVITLGDEFQGLFYDALVAFEVITYLQVKYPINIRYGIGIGKLYTELNKNAAIGSDGPVWWEARKAINESKKRKTNITIYGLKDNSIEELINNSLLFIYYSSSKWTKMQKNIIKKIIKSFHLDNSFKQIDLANKYKIDASKVNRAIKMSNFFEYVNISESISKLINKEREEHD